MGDVLRLAIVDPDVSTRGALKAMLLGMDMIWLEAECSRYEFFADVVTQTNPDIAVVVIDREPTKGLDLVARLTESSPHCSVLVVSSSRDGRQILQALRAGAKEFLTQPVGLEDLLGALGQINKRHSSQSETTPRSSQVIAIAGSTGGVGTTSLAVNLGCILARDERNSVALLDLDLCLGDADVFLDAVSEHTLADVAKNIERMDFAMLKGSLTRHSSGLSLLPRPVQLEDINQVTPEGLQRIIGLMQATFTHVLLDLSKGFSAIDRMALEMANEVFLVAQLDYSSLRNVLRLMKAFNQTNIGGKVKIVVNRMGLDSGQITLKKAQETIGKKAFWQLPNDYGTMVEVRNNAVPLLEQAPNAAITLSMLGLAKTLACDEPQKLVPSATQASTMGRLFHFWPGKSDK